MKVFVSYSHAQKNWVWNRLESCLRAGGADVLIDHLRFVAGPAIVGQMDAVQDQAARHLLVLSREYLKSKVCLHEMKRAIRLDPTFTRQLVIPIRRDRSVLPSSVTRPNALYVNLQDDSKTDQWTLLLDACRVNLGIGAPPWLATRDELLHLLQKDQSINLVVKGSAQWRGLIEDLVGRPMLKLARVDLQDPSTVSRRGMIASILNALGATGAVPDPPEDLPYLGRVLGTLPRSRLVLQHFDLVPFRSEYDENLFAALRYLVMDTRQLVLVVQSRAPFHALLPSSNPLSFINLRTVEL